MADSDELESDGTRVSLMTLHTAKGLEYPAVFVVGLEEGIFPHFRSLSEPSELEEERRLFYVGITRARQHLAISHAWSRTTWGRTQPAMPSRFVDRGARRTWSRTSGWARPGGGPATRRTVGRRAPPRRDVRAGRAAGRPGQRRPKAKGPGASTGAEDLGLARGRRGGARPLGPRRRGSAKGEGARAQATVDFDTVGKKNLLLSATPLRAER